MDDLENAYSEIFKVLNKYKYLVNIDIDRIKKKSDCHLFGNLLKESYGFNIDSKSISNTNFQELSEYTSKEKVCIGWWGPRYNRTISWPTTDAQPDNELLLSIGFPCGHYSFGEDAAEMFYRFFNELKTYGPKFMDDNNNNLFFSMNNAGDIFNKFPDISNKYRKEFRDGEKQRTIKKMEYELEKLGWTKSKE